MSTNQEPLNLIETFKKRHSVKSYLGQNLTQDQVQFIEQSISEANSLQTPFQSQGVEVSTTGPGLARFGSISNEAGWIVLKMKNNKEKANEEQERRRIIDVSYIAQHVLMKLASHNISSSWVAGTFDEDEAEKRFPGFKIPAVIAYGIEQLDQSFLRKMFNKIGSRTSRMNFDQLFYDKDNKRMFSESDFTGKSQNVPNYKPYMKDFLESVRSGPSALNQQPWRFVLTGNEVRVYDAKLNNYSHFDIGIALANLELLKEIRGESCTFDIKNPPPKTFHLEGKYIISVIYQE